MIEDTTELEVVPIIGLRTVWPELRARVQGIIDRSGDPMLVEDVFAAILRGEAYLWTTPNLGCFVVLQVQVSSHGARDLHVWLASEETEHHAVDYMDQIRHIGREAQCDRVTFESPRKWGRALPGLTIRYLYSFET